MSQMFNPPHPGENPADTVLREDGGISVTAFAEKFGMTRTAISRVIHGNAAMSTDPSRQKLTTPPRILPSCPPLLLRSCT